MVAPAVGAALISGATSLIGGFFKKRDAKKAAREARETALEDYRTSGVRAREAAELGGFNPLTFLGLTGGAPQMPSGISDISSGDVIASALSNGAQAFLSYDPIYEESLKLENELTRARIDQIRGELDAPAFTPDVITPTNSIPEFYPTDPNYYYNRESGLYEFPGGETWDPKQRAPHEAREAIYGSGSEIESGVDWLFGWTGLTPMNSTSGLKFPKATDAGAPLSQPGWMQPIAP